MDGQLTTLRFSSFSGESRFTLSLCAISGAHSNIAGVYGFDESNGARFLVMEYVEGQTLSSRLDAGALPVDETLDIARQIAEALEEAHERGVIHRDLKPGNVMITPEGKVKVLDFGLAKAMTDDPSSVSDANSPTITADFTKPGVVLGTAAYMSPEPRPPFAAFFFDELRLHPHARMHPKHATHAMMPNSFRITTRRRQSHSESSAPIGASPDDILLMFE